MAAGELILNDQVNQFLRLRPGNQGAAVGLQPQAVEFRAARDVLERLALRLELDGTSRADVDALRAAATNTLPIAYAPCSSATPHLRAGKLKVIGLLDKKRNPELPDFPAMGESIPDYEKIGGGVDLYGPAGLPASSPRMAASIPPRTSAADRPFCASLIPKRCAAAFLGAAEAMLSATAGASFSFVTRA